jgi:tRNA dimethylallyltransferase
MSLFKSKFISLSDISKAPYVNVQHFSVASIYYIVTHGIEIINMSKITVIIGPTAIGKSELAINLARESGGEVISADAFQVYRGMDIGTAKVETKILEEIPHHLINILNPDEPYNVVDFINRTNQLINELKERNTPIIICGGTGMYLRAFLYNYSFPEEQDKSDIEKELQIRLEKEGIEPLYNELMAINPELKEILHINNHRRVLRNLEIYHQSGQKPTEVKKQEQTPRKDVSIIGLTDSRELIYERINNRVNTMIKEGLVGEVETLIKKYPQDSYAFQALGYKETISYLNGGYDLKEMIELIQRKTRNFAKRQLTWFKKIDNVEWRNIN